MRDYLTLLSNTNRSTKTISIRSSQDMEALENGSNILLNKGVGQLGSFPDMFRKFFPLVHN